MFSIISLTSSSIRAGANSPNAHSYSSSDSSCSDLKCPDICGWRTFCSTPSRWYGFSYPASRRASVIVLLTNPSSMSSEYPSWRSWSFTAAICSAIYSLIPRFARLLYNDSSLSAAVMSILLTPDASIITHFVSGLTASSISC